MSRLGGGIGKEVGVQTCRYETSLSLEDTLQASRVSATVASRRNFLQIMQKLFNFEILCYEDIIALSHT